MDDEFRQQRVVQSARLVALVAEGIHPNARALGWAERGQGARARYGNAVRAKLFHVDAQLDGVATWGWRVAVAQAQVRQRGTAGNRQLGAHQVHAGDRLRDRMLDLNARVGLDEIERRSFAEVRAVHQEFEGADIVVAGRVGERDGRLENPLPQRRV